MKCTTEKSTEKRLLGGGRRVWFPLRPYATDLLVSGTCRGGQERVVKKKKGCTEKRERGSEKVWDRKRKKGAEGGAAQRGRAGNSLSSAGHLERERGGARGRIPGRSSAGAASPDLDQSPLLRLEASCCHEQERWLPSCAPFSSLFYFFFSFFYVCAHFAAIAQLFIFTSDHLKLSSRSHAVPSLSFFSTLVGKSSICPCEFCLFVFWKAWGDFFYVFVVLYIALCRSSLTAAVDFF